LFEVKSLPALVFFIKHPYGNGVMEFFSYLKKDEISYVHEASLEILDEVGLLVRNEKARNRFAEHGARVDHETEIVRIPPAIVEKYRAMVPPTITLRGRDPACDITFPRKLPVIATASSAPDIVDPVTGITRRATSDDIARIAHLVNELPGFDMFSISVLADDAPPGQFNLSRFYPALKNCLKPCRTSVTDVREAEQVLKLGELIAGSKQAYKERPFINFGYCAVVSPLTMDYDSTEMLMYFAENDITAYGTIAPMGGLSTPLSLAGMLTLMNAEWLAAATLAQMSKPGTQQIYNFLPVFADMRDGAYAPGAIEIGMMNAAVCQMARHYNVPAGGYLGLTNAKIADAQSGFEKGMSPLLGAMAGVDFIVMGGLQDALMSFDFGQAVIDNEIALMIKRVRDGFDFSKENVSLDEIKATGPAGMFAATPQSLERMHTATFMPDLADRKLREQWELEGSSSIHQRAMNKALEILSTPNTAALEPEVDGRIRAEFDGLVKGDSVVPDGWSQIKIGSGEPARARRKNRRRGGK
jgi:trimethylamine---corrinoid protein Co-methyltransferase